MSLITRCPACHTMFKVVRDQLRISDGWVRCGHCDEIFDAAAHLQDAVPRTSFPAAAPDAEEPAPQAIAPETDTLVSADSELREGASASEPVLSIEVPDSGAWAETMVVDGRDAGQPAIDAVPAAPDECETAEAEPSVLPSFMREIPASAVAPPGARRRVGYAVAAVMLTLLMAVQVLVHERDRLAGSAPALRPLLENLCALLQCSVAPLKQIESVQIDSAAFAKMRPEVYRLSLTLKNTASTDLALPAIELSLTDTQDQPVLRRVILAGELGLSGETLVAGAEATVSLTLGVKAPDGTEQFAGYRVLAFYP